MSKIYVAEFSGLGGTDQGDSVNILGIPSLAEYSIIVSAGSSGGPALQPTTKFVELSTDTTASFAIGGVAGVVGTGSATLSNCRLSPGERIVRRVPFSQGTPQAAAAYSIFTTANV